AGLENGPPGDDAPAHSGQSNGAVLSRSAGRLGPAAIVSLGRGLNYALHRAVLLREAQRAGRILQSISQRPDRSRLEPGRAGQGGALPGRGGGFGAAQPGSLPGGTEPDAQEFAQTAAVQPEKAISGRVGFLF